MATVMTFALVALLVLAALFDLRERRVPNALTVTGAAAALCIRLVWGWGSVMEGAEGMVLAVLVGLAPFVLGLLGGGDVKLLGAVGAFVGMHRLFGALLLVGVVGGLLAMLEATRQRALLRTLANVGRYARQWVLFGRAGLAPTVETIDSPEAMTVPYGVAIAVGSLLWWFIGGAAL